jgi:retron-type reverse transcriptase
VEGQRSAGKPFDISKEEVWQAWLKVSANDGAAGADGVSLEIFGEDLKGNLYKIWNRMSSGTWFALPVRGVEIPKDHGRGTRLLGIPRCRGQDRADCGRGPDRGGGGTGVP